MARFEHPDGRFCEIAIEGKVVAVRDAAGLTAKTLATTTAARAHQAKLVKRLVADGFADPEELRRRALQAPPNAELERAIAADPTDAGARLVYADWLTERGDPRGELIVLQHRNAKARAAKLLAKHRDMWLGELAAPKDPKDVRLTWHLGFLDAVELRSDELMADAIAELARLPSARFVRTLVLGGTSDYVAAVAALVKTGWPQCLERLSLGHQRPGEYLPGSNRCGEVGALLAKHPRLVDVDLSIERARLERFALPHAKRFTLRYATTEQLDAVAAASWPALERLGLCIPEPPRLRRILAAKLDAPALRELELHVWRDDQLAAIAAHASRWTHVALRFVADKAWRKGLAAAVGGRKFELVADDA